MKMEGMSLGVIGRTEDMSQEDKREQEKEKQQQRTHILLGTCNYNVFNFIDHQRSWNNMAVSYLEFFLVFFVCFLRWLTWDNVKWKGTPGIVAESMEYVITLGTVFLKSTDNNLWTHIYIQIWLYNYYNENIPKREWLKCFFKYNSFQ